MKIKKSFIVALLMMLMPINHAFAHKVIVFAWVEDGMIFTESSFGSKRNAKNCAIIVADEKGRVIHKGQTDTQGNYSFKIPDNIDSELVINLEAGTGHKARWVISKEELMAEPAVTDLKDTMEKKENFEKSPSVFKILGGIGIIFLLALVLKWASRVVKKKKASND